MIKQLTINDITKAFEFVLDEKAIKSSKHEYELLRRLLFDDHSCVFGYYDRLSRLVGLASASISNDESYFNFLHCRTTLRKTAQMIILVKLMLRVEQWSVSEGAKAIFLTLVNLFDQAVRRGYRLFLNQGIAKTVVKELM